MSNDATKLPGEPPKIIAGRYRLGKSLGRGTYGQVFYAEDIKFDPPRTVAVKLLHSQFLGDAQSREDIRREASVLARFHHPNILRVSDFEISSDMAYIVTDFAEGGSLANKIKPESSAPPVPLPLNEVIYYLEQIASALDEAHNLGLIHRDIKPLNILLDRAGRPLLADFGLATVLSGTTSSMVELSASGTPLYMAPEQWAGRAGKASDIYALGIVTYQLITGQPPYQGNQAALWAQHTGAPIPALREKAPWLDYPSALDSVIAGVMAKDDRERTRPAGEFARRFKMALTGYQATPFNVQNIPPQFRQGQSGPMPGTYQPGSNLPPSSIPPMTNQPGTAPGSQPFNYQPGGTNYNNASSLPMGVISGPGQPSGTPSFGQNQPGPTSTNRPQSSETLQSTPIDTQPPSQPFSGQTYQPSQQQSNRSGVQGAGSQPQTYWPQQGANPDQGPNMPGGPFSPGNQPPNWNNGGAVPIPAPAPVVTKKKGGLNLVLIGVAALIALAIVIVALLILLPKNSSPQTPTQVAASVTVTPGSGTSTTADGTTASTTAASETDQSGSAAGTGQVQVTVTESAGKPAREADVNLKVFKVGSDTPVQTVYSKATATISLPAGSYTIQALYPNDIAVKSPVIEVKEGQTVTQPINLGVGTVQVAVVEAAGRSPRENDIVLRVYKDGDTSKVITTVYGKATTSIYLLPGSYQLETDYSNDITELGTTFQVTEGQATTQSVNLAVGTVQVEIYEAAGKIAQDDSTKLTVHKQNDPNATVTTIYSKAKTSITLKEGTYEIEVQYGGVTVTQTSQPFEVKAGQTVTSTVTLGVGNAQVQVQKADGSKIDESTLVLRVFTQDNLNDPVATVYSKAASSFALKPGTYVVEVQYTDGKDTKKTTGDPLEVKEGQTATQTIKI